MTLPRVRLPIFPRQITRQYMHPGEQDLLLTLVNSVRPKIMVEIGVNIGLTAQAALRDIVTIERYIGIDVLPGYQFEIPAQQVERPNEPGRLVKHDPRFRLVLYNEDMPTSADVIFIDGDHGKHAVFRDSIWAAEIVTPGGMIIWHDYGNPTVEVTGVLDALQAEGRDLKHVVDTWLVFEQR